MTRPSRHPGPQSGPHGDSQLGGQTPGPPIQSPTSPPQPTVIAPTPNGMASNCKTRTQNDYKHCQLADRHIETKLNESQQTATDDQGRIANVVEVTKDYHERVANIIEATKDSNGRVTKLTESTKDDHERLAKVMEATNYDQQRISNVVDVTKDTRKPIIEAVGQSAPVVPLHKPPQKLDLLETEAFGESVQTLLRPHLRDIPKTQSLDLRHDDEVPGCSDVSKAGSMEPSALTREMRARLLVTQQSRSLGRDDPACMGEGAESPGGSPRTVRRRPPLRESRRVSIDASGSYLQLNQYKLMEPIGQVGTNFIYSFIIKTREKLWVGRKGAIAY